MLLNRIKLLDVMRLSVIDFINKPWLDHYLYCLDTSDDGLETNYGEMRNQLWHTQLEGAD